MEEHLVIAYTALHLIDKQKAEIKKYLQERNEILELLREFFRRTVYPKRK